VNDSNQRDKLLIIGFQFLQDVVEYMSKISNTVINLLGIIGLIIGLSEIQELQYREPENSLILEMDLVSFTLAKLFNGTSLGTVLDHSDCFVFVLKQLCLITFRAD